MRRLTDFNPSSPSLSVGGTTNTNILPTSGDPCDGDPNDPNWISPIICGQVEKGAGCNPVENHCQNGGICLSTKQHQSIVLSSFHYKCFNNSTYEEGSRDGGNFDLCKPENNDCQVNYICTNTIFPSGSIYSACKNSSGTSSTGASPAPDVPPIPGVSTTVQQPSFTPAEPPPPLPDIPPASPGPQPILPLPPAIPGE